MDIIKKPEDLADTIAEIYFNGTICNGCRFENKACTLRDCKQKWSEYMNEQYKYNKRKDVNGEKDKRYDLL